MQTRDYFEPRFGADFSRVRLHAGDQAAQSAGSIKALAYTLGNNVVFGAGQYQPNTVQGKRLLAHELTHVVQQSTASDAVTLRRTPLEGEAEQDLSARLSELIPAAPSERGFGPVEPEVLARARNFLTVTRNVLNDVHRDLNTLLSLMDGLSGFVSTDVLDRTLALTILYEGLDALAVAVPESAEAATTLVAKTIKVLVLTDQRRRQAEAANRSTLARVSETANLFDLLVEAQTAADDLLDRVQYEPELAALLADQPVPRVPRRAATRISRELELRLMVSVLRRTGANVDTGETETVTLGRSEDVTTTAMYINAQGRHADPLDNFWLRRLRIRAEWSTLDAILAWDASAGATGRTEYSWYYWRIAGVSEDMVAFILRRLSTIGISKDRLFELLLGPMLRYR